MNQSEWRHPVERVGWDGEVVRGGGEEEEEEDDEHGKADDHKQYRLSEHLKFLQPGLFSPFPTPAPSTPAPVESYLCRLVKITGNRCVANHNSFSWLYEYEWHP